MFLPLISVILLSLTLTLSQGQLSDICAELCARVSYAERPEVCLESCEALMAGEQFNDELPPTYYDSYGNELEAETPEVDGVDKRSRLGYVLNAIRRPSRRLPKQQKSAFVRIGRSADVYSDRSPLFRIQDAEGHLKRTSSFVRIGKRRPEDPEKRGSGFVRIGRPSSFVRIGKATHGSGFVRIGKSADDTESKRASSFVRIGKSVDVLDPKRTSSFVRIGKKSAYTEGAGDKRASSFVRIGKSSEDPGEEEEKRVSSFVRIGKSTGDEEAKRASSFVRIGKRDVTE